MRRFPFGQLLCLSALTLLAGWTYTSVFSVGDVAWLVLAAVSMPALVSLGMRSWPKPRLLIVTLVHVGLYILFVTLLVFPKTASARLVPSGATFTAMADGLRSGWALILSSTVPVPGLAGALFVPMTLTWIATFVGTEVLFRTRRVFLTLLPAVLLGISGILFSDGSSGSFAGGAFLFVAAAAALLATRASSFDSDPRAFDDRELSFARRDHDDESFHSGLGGALFRQRVAMASLFIVVVVLVAVPLAARLPFVNTDAQTVLRDHYVVPAEDRHQVSPLAEVAGAFGDDTVRYRVVLDAQVGGKALMRTAVLDSYDGVSWSSSGLFITTGSRLAGEPPVNAEVQRVGQQVTVVDAVTPWLPTLDRPVTLAIRPETGAQVDRVTGAVFVPDGPQAGSNYSITSDVVHIRPEQLQAAGVATDTAARATVGAVAGLPPDVAALQGEVLSAAGSPFQQLARLLAFFRNNPAVNTGKPFELNEKAAPNFTIGGLTTFLSQERGRSGRPEQFAAAFATLAKSAGFPVRVVVGYRLPDDPPANREIDVHASDLTAWPEVALDGLGWVPLDPVPSDQTSSELTVEEQQLDAVVNAAVDQSIDDPEDPTAENPNLDPVVVVDDEAPSARFVLILLGAAVILILLLTLPLVRKRSRRSRRRSDDDPARRAAGAWSEAMDRLVEADIENPHHLTARQAADVVNDRFGPEAGSAIGSMGSLVNQALHDRPSPSVEIADEAWQHERLFEEALRHAQTRRMRLRASFDRRPLVSDIRD